MKSLINFGVFLGSIYAVGVAAFQNPIRKPGPDPSVVFANGFYHLSVVSTHSHTGKSDSASNLQTTTPSCYNPLTNHGSRTYTSYDHIEITRSKTLGGLLTGETKTIWSDTNTTRNANMWAPEIHKIDNIWHMFYSSCDSALPCCDSCHTRVLRGCNKAAPFDCTYTHLADLVPPTGSLGGPKSDFAFSIDGTYLEIPGKGRYHVLSIINKDELQSIAITELDTKKWTVDGWHVISVPDQPWEKNTTNSNPNSITAVNEAPHPLYHNGEVWLAYSASYCGTPNYSLGLLHYNGGDPLKASSWVKKGPVFSQANGNYGTGHNCFFTSPDGKETWNAFHATNNPKGSCGTDRFTLAQKVTFKSGNVPDFGIPQPLSAIIHPPSGE